MYVISLLLPPAHSVQSLSIILSEETGIALRICTPVSTPKCVCDFVTNGTDSRESAVKVLKPETQMRANLLTIQSKLLHLHYKD